MGIEMFLRVFSKNISTHLSGGVLCCCLIWPIVHLTHVAHLTLFTCFTHSAGKGVMSLTDALDLLAPALSDQEVIYYQSLLELAAGELSVCGDAGWRFRTVG